MMAKMIACKCAICGKEVYVAEKVPTPLCVDCFKAKIEEEREARK